MKNPLVLLPLCLFFLACSSSSDPKDPADTAQDTAADLTTTDAPGDAAIENDTMADVQSEDDLATDTADDMTMPDEMGDDVQDVQGTDIDEGTIPDSPAGAQLQWLLDTFELGYVKSEGVTEHFSAAFLGEMSASGYSYNLNQTISAVGAMEVVNLLDTGNDDSLMAVVWSEKMKVMMYLGLTVEAEAPHLIAVWVLAFAPMLDDAAGGALAENELGVFLYDPYMGGGVFEATVEAVNRETGESFEPPVVVEAGPNYPWARLTLPEGVDEVGLRITEPNGYVTRFYSATLVAGFGKAEAPAFPAEAPAAYLEELELTQEASASHVWGFIKYEEDILADDPMNLLAATDSPWVGCAEITFTGAEATALYSEPDLGWPDPEAPSTSPDYSTWWAFNVANVPVTVTATAAGGSVSVDLPILEEDGVTVVETYFTAPDFTSNPAAENCGE